MTSQVKKRVLVTGGARRLGAAISEALHSAGWEVLIHYFHAETGARVLQQELGEDAYLLQADLTKEAEVKQLLEEAGQLDAIIHNASLFERDGLKKFDWQKAEQHMRLHSFCAVECASHLRRQHRHPSCLILLGDGLKQKSNSPAFLSYALSCRTMEALPELLGEAMAPYSRLYHLGLGVTLPQEGEDKEMLARVTSSTAYAKPTPPEEVTTLILRLLETQTLPSCSINMAEGGHTDLPIISEK